MPGSCRCPGRHQGAQLGRAPVQRVRRRAVSRERNSARAACLGQRRAQQRAGPQTEFSRSRAVTFRPAIRAPGRSPDAASCRTRSACAVSFSGSSFAAQPSTSAAVAASPDHARRPRTWAVSTSEPARCRRRAALAESSVCPASSSLWHSVAAADESRRRAALAVGEVRP